MAETEHLWVHSEGQHLFPAAPLQKLNQELPWELPICQPHLCASEDHGGHVIDIKSVWSSVFSVFKNLKLQWDNPLLFYKNVF